MKSLFRFLLLIGVGYVIYIILFGTPQISEPRRMEIPRGAGVKEIAETLKEANLIRSRFGFETLVWLRRAGSRLQAGEYTFQPSMSLTDIVRMLTRGLGAVNERELTIVEGWTAQEVADYLEAQGFARKQEFMSIAGSSSTRQRLDITGFGFLRDKPDGVGLEGYLFPDTYRVFRDANTEAIARRMLENFSSKLTAEMQADITSQGKTIFDIVRMASIVEAEVPHEEDRPIISGILWKRLDAGMALQVDSTLNYAIDGRNSALTSQQLQIDSPYNTYKYRGLPPTPIGNPGLSAIRAAIYPRHTAYWYFLSGKDGTTYFAKTLDEHNINKAKYLR
ncbi:MAG: Aminodeoxychorismate lyase [Parcubacteria group bacterium GW2011_GWC2_45_7]|nr:MAG: Aminodeoxychorismate lyase [Parcubacteria group bacterium GW2011_GWC2_45_7]KKU72863.1 MAG: Aminodeoxychorismate lyase [Parcubacteria group bacterium GW2011_GWA2_47_26]